MQREGRALVLRGVLLVLVLVGRPRLRCLRGLCECGLRLRLLRDLQLLFFLGMMRDRCGHFVQGSRNQPSTLRHVCTGAGRFFRLLERGFDRHWLLKFLIIIHQNFRLCMLSQRGAALPLLHGENALQTSILVITYACHTCFFLLNINNRFFGTTLLLQFLLLLSFHSLYMLGYLPVMQTSKWCHSRTIALHSTAIHCNLLFLLIQQLVAVFSTTLVCESDGNSLSERGVEEMRIRIPFLAHFVCSTRGTPV